ncbi:hypothetical protein [Paenibacillus pinihumi]|uniref:hypothetical protein n=1 Tax=Paenibacillus pinihumi TaxID=669462 RepID=UPI000420E28B|nr:hypothetical protein [Paenibacillus pinihumi]
MNVAMKNQMNSWFEQARAEGPESTREYLQYIARTLGLQVAEATKPDEIPAEIAVIVENFGKGMTAGTLIHHGKYGVLDLNVFQVHRTRP